jgi:hypothetical protein
VTSEPMVASNPLNGVATTPSCSNVVPPGPLLIMLQRFAHALGMIRGPTAPVPRRGERSTQEVATTGTGMAD